MQGVTTAIVLFIFVAICFPRLIDNRPQYYVALICTLLIILMDGLTGIFSSENFDRFAHMAIALLQIAAVLLLFLSAGGLTARGLTKEMASAFEVIRRGEKEKELIIPIGEQGREKERKRAIDTIGEAQRYEISAEEAEGANYPPKPAPPRKEEGGPLPMD